MKFGLGCSPSVMDGTEYVANVEAKIALPSVYDLSQAMPPVRNQGKTSTCVCQSLVGCLDFYTNEMNQTPHQVNGYSIEELYSTRANKNINGMQIKEALHYLRHYGLNNYKINAYARVMSIDALKKCLVLFGPCVGGLPVYSSSPLYFWLNKGGKFMGGHAITFVGYNETGFIIRNSWGVEWGDNGHVTIPYQEFLNSCFEVWTITF